MITRDYFSHTIPGYGKVWDKLSAVGYCYKLAGENIGWNNYPDDIATAAIQQMFMDSAGHRDNILGKAWDTSASAPTRARPARRCGPCCSPTSAGRHRARRSRPRSRRPSPRRKPTPQPTRADAAPDPTPDPGRRRSRRADRQAGRADRPRPRRRRRPRRRHRSSRRRRSIPAPTTDRSATPAIATTEPIHRRARSPATTPRATAPSACASSTTDGPMVCSSRSSAA